MPENTDELSQGLSQLAPEAKQIISQGLGQLGQAMQAFVEEVNTVTNGQGEAVLELFLKKDENGMNIPEEAVRVIGSDKIKKMIESALMPDESGDQAPAGLAARPTAPGTLPG